MIDKQGNDAYFMRMAVRLADKGAGFVNPNPRVGAVVVRNGHIVGTGYHEYFGGPHAEVNALSQAGKKAHGATLYVTLEPCNHEGKTPPCAPRIAESGISRVVIGMPDPNPDVQGNGADYLRGKGIEVVTGVLEEMVHRQNSFFLKFILERRPYGILKSAMSLDGKTATVSGESQWISGEKSRREVHRLRSQVAAIVVGVDTVIADNPLLNVRLPGKNQRNPLKVIVDSAGRLPLDANVLLNEPQLAIIGTTQRADPGKRRAYERLGAQVLVCPERDGHVDLVYLTAALGTMGIDSILVESGGTLSFAALEAGIIDRVLFYIAPKIIGGKTAPTVVGGKGVTELTSAFPLKNMRWRRSGEDLVVEGIR